MSPAAAAHLASPLLLVANGLPVEAAGPRRRSAPESGRGALRIRAGFEQDPRGPDLAVSPPTPMADTPPTQPRAAGEQPDGTAIVALYDEIRRLARSLMRKERADHTLAPTALANEAYLRLFGSRAPTFANDGQFLAAAITTLRCVLVDHQRRRQRQKRGSGRVRRGDDLEQLPASLVDDRVLALEEALQRLAAFDPTKARLVELRFYGGLSVDEAARVLEVSPRTAARDWRVARAFLRTELQGKGDDGLDP